MQQRWFGCHVSASGGLATALRVGAALGVNTIQLHPSPPQRWNTKPFEAGVEDECNAARAASGVERIFFHGIYLINLANPDRQKLKLSILSLVNDLDLSARLHGDGVIFHVGSNVHQKNEEDGFRQVGDVIKEILAESNPASRLILEVAAGSGAVIGDTLEELARIYEYAGAPARVGFGLDTQHLWASGYDLATKLDEVIANIGQAFGFDRVWSLHLNDSKTELGSRKDRHENLGQGLIGAEALRAVLARQELRQVPIILETPDLDTPEGAAKEVATLRSMLT